MKPVYVHAGGGWVGKYIDTNEAVGIDNYGTIVITSRKYITGNHINHNLGLLTLTNG